MFLYLFIYLLNSGPCATARAPRPPGAGPEGLTFLYGQFSKFHVCFCGLDSGNLKLETVRTNKQHICF